MVLLFEDEISLSLMATVSYKWAERGQQPLIACIQRKRQRQTIFGSVDYESGQLVISRADKGNAKTFQKHLQKVLRTYKESNVKIIIVADNVRYHHAKIITAFLERNKQKIEIVFLPPYSPDLNPIERVWWYMRKRVTHNQYFHSFDERIRAFWIFMSAFLHPNKTIADLYVLNY